MLDTTTTYEHNLINILEIARGYGVVRYHGTCGLSVTRDEVVKYTSQREWGYESPPLGYRELLVSAGAFSIILHTN